MKVAKYVLVLIFIAIILQAGQSCLDQIHARLSTSNSGSMVLNSYNSNTIDTSTGSSIINDQTRVEASNLSPSDTGE